MPMPTLTEALTHLRAYRATLGGDALVHEATGLSAADLDTIIAACTQSPDDQVIEQLGDLA